jgi:hypothetical protein
MASIQLSIADPCHENWNQMLPEDKGRFCLSCQKTVVDFTNMSDGQVFDYFKNYKGNTCGQFSPQQLDRQIAKPKTYAIGKWKYFWQILLPAVFAFYKSDAQTKLMGKVATKTVCKPDSSKPVTMRIGMVAPNRFEEPRYLVNGTVIGEDGKPVGFATVNSGNQYVVADSIGKFSISLKRNEELQISYIGYDSKTIRFDSLKAEGIKKIMVVKGTAEIEIDMDILLKQSENVMPEVFVTSDPNSLYRDIIAGGISYVRENKIFPDKVVVAIAKEPALKILPNPIHSGQDFKVRPQVKKSGSYLLRIIDANGKILTEQKISVEKGQDTTVSGVALQQAGIYIINVLDAGNKKDKGLTGKLVVQ